MEVGDELHAPAALQYLYGRIINTCWVKVNDDSFCKWWYPERNIVLFLLGLELCFSRP
jgi:hypothetical protein